MPRRLPDADFFLPPPVKASRLRRMVLAKSREGRVVHVTHGGCLDGAGSDVMVRVAHGDAHVSTVFSEPGDITPKLALIAGEGIGGEGRSLLLSDVSPRVDEREALERALGQLNELGWRIEWRDHHGKQWAGGMLEAVRRKADHVRVDLDNHECGTSLCQQDLVPHDAWAKDLAAVVRDVDLWVRKDPRSETLTDARHHLGSRALVEKLLRDRVVLDAELERAARAHREALDRDLRGAIAAARIVEGRNKVGVLYGDFPGSQACDALRTARRTDVEVAIKPDGKFSIRSRPGLPLCQEVAQRFQGGGHPNASGGKLRLAPWEWPLLWATGRCAQGEALARAAAEARVPGEGAGVP